MWELSKKKDGVVVGKEESQLQRNTNPGSLEARRLRHEMIGSDNRSRRHATINFGRDCIFQ
jgi:hypothetical protein